MPTVVKGGIRLSLYIFLCMRLAKGGVLAMVALSRWLDKQGGGLGDLFCSLVALGGVAECMADLSRLRWLSY